MKLFLTILMLVTVLFPVASSYAIRLQQNEVQFDIDPTTLQIRVGKVVVNDSQPPQQVSALSVSPTQASWQWPHRHMQMTASVEGQDLRLTFVSRQPQLFTWFTLPSQATELQLPIGEGSRIPLNNAPWLTYLTSELASIDTNFDLKLPLWGQQQQQHLYSWLLLSPFNNQISFEKCGQQLLMRSSHDFNQLNQQQPFEVLLHVGTTPLSGALRYREYLKQSGQLSSLYEKMAIAPEGKKLIGASHLYLWGNTLLAQEDVKNWTGMLSYLQSASGKPLWQHIDAENRKTLLTLQGREPEGWQKQSLIEAINHALTAQAPFTSSPESASFLLAQQQQALDVRQLAQRQLGAWLSDPAQWGPGLSETVINALSQVGLTRLWLGTDNWTAAFLHPQAVKRAKEAGYLIASYDSYDTGIPPGLNDSWLTAQMPEKLRERCAIMRGDGTKKPGFGGEGYYLNPACVLPFSQQRMREVIQLAGLNSLFLDVDGTGMVSDDYQPAHPTGAAQMAEARNARMAWFSNTIRLPLGSEDGNAVTARHIMFAHGMETWGFGWRDSDMRHNKKSPYYLGAWWPSAQPATFFSPARIKPLYHTVVFDPRFRLPLYQAVFHDAVITTHHWTLDNLKFGEVKKTRSLLSGLYNTSPLFNLSRGSLRARLPEIIRADASFRVLHQALWDKALTGFRWLDQEGWVQQTHFSDGSTLTANFSERPFNGIAAQTLRADLEDGRSLSFTE